MAGEETAFRRSHSNEVQRGLIPASEIRTAFMGPVGLLAHAILSEGEIKTINGPAW